MGLFKNIGRLFGGEDVPSEFDEGYVELSTEAASDKQRILVRPFVLEEFEDIKPIIDAVREGYTIALVNIRPLKEKDLVELKRAINKIKKTVDASEGDIAGFGEDWITVVPSFATIHRERRAPEPVQQQAQGYGEDYE